MTDSFLYAESNSPRVSNPWRVVIIYGIMRNHSSQEVEQGLKGAYYWNDWRNNMKTIDSSQTAEIDELFVNWY